MALQMRSGGNPGLVVLEAHCLLCCIVCLHGSSLLTLLVLRIRPSFVVGLRNQLDIWAWLCVPWCTSFCLHYTGYLVVCWVTGGYIFVLVAMSSLICFAPHLQIWAPTPAEQLSPYV